MVRGRTGTLDRPKSEGVHQEDGARSHGENVSDYPSHPGGRTLERLDLAGMVLAFHLERHRPTVTDIDHSGILFPGFSKNFSAGGWQIPQISPCLLVATQIASHPSLVTLHYIARSALEATFA